MEITVYIDRLTNTRERIRENGIGMEKDLQDCLSVRRTPSRKFALPGKASREMAEEIVLLTGGDRKRVQILLTELVFHHPDHSLDWYFEKIIAKLQENKKRG